MMVQLPGEQTSICVPTHAMEGLKPGSWAAVKVSDTAGDLCLTETAAPCRSVVSGSREPAYRSEIVQILCWIQASSLIIATINQAPLRIPVINRLEISFLSKFGQNLGIIEANPGRLIIDLLIAGGQEGIQIRQNIIPLLFLEYLPHTITPGTYIQIVDQLILEEIIHPFSTFGVHGILEGLEILLNH